MWVDRFGFYEREIKPLTDTENNSPKREIEDNPRG